MFYCTGYRVSLTEFNCIENQLSDYCLPGFPCHECESAITLRLSPKKERRVSGLAFLDDMTPAVRRAMGL